MIKNYPVIAGVLCKRCKINPINITDSAPITFSQRKPRPIIFLLSRIKKITTITSETTADQNTAVPLIFLQ